MPPLPAKLFALSDRSTRGFLPDRAIAFLHAANGQYNPDFSTFNAAEFSLGTTLLISGQIATIRQIQFHPAVHGEESMDTATEPLVVVVAHGNALLLAAGRHPAEASLTR